MYVHVQGLPVYVYSNMHACICPHNFSIKSPPGKVCSTETSGSTLLHRLGVVLKPLFLTLGGNICKIEVKPQWFIKRLSIPTIHPQSIKKNPTKFIRSSSHPNPSSIKKHVPPPGEQILIPCCCTQVPSTAAARQAARPSLEAPRRELTGWWFQH